MNTRRNRSLNNTNDISEEEEVTDTIQRTRKIIRGSRKNRASLESETQLKWQLSEDQKKEAYSRLLFFWQLFGGAESTPPNKTRKLEAAEEENVPVISSRSESNESLRSDIQVIKVDLTTTKDNEEEQCVCAIEPPGRNIHFSRKETELQKQLGGDQKHNLSKLFDN